jgi:hypothetical protein
MRVLDRASSHTECPGAAGLVAGSSAWTRRFGRSGSPECDSRMAARAERVWRSRTRALAVVSLVAVLVLAAGFGSAAGVAPPPTGVPGPASAIGTRGMGGGFSGAVAALSERREAGTLVASQSGATVPGAQAGPRAEAPSAIRAQAVVSQAIAPRPSAIMRPVKVPLASAAELNRPSVTVASLASSTPRRPGTITIETFGYSFGGAPEGCAFVADVRNISAGPFLPSETGLMPGVRERVMATSAAQEWLRVFTTEWAPALKDGDRVAIGCSMGHHRSVTLALLFAEDLKARGYAVNLEHRDILRAW